LFNHGHAQSAFGSIAHNAQAVDAGSDDNKVEVRACFLGVHEDSSVCEK
jgi:hypothetical protein